MGGARQRAFANHPPLHLDRLSRPTRTSPSFLRPSPSFLRPSPSFLRRQEPTHPNTLSSSNSSLPPSRGEVRWGVRGNERLPTTLPYTSIASPVLPAPLRHSCAPLRHSCAGRNRAPFRHSCAGRNPHAPHYPPIPSPIHPSPLPGGRLGGGCEATSVCQPPSPTPRSPLPSYSPPSSFLPSLSVIPAQEQRRGRVGRERGLPLLPHAEEVEQRRVAVDVCAAVDEQRLTGHQRRGVAGQVES